MQHTLNKKPYLFTLLLSAISLPTYSCPLSLTIDNIKDSHGTLLIAAYKKNDSTNNAWPKKASNQHKVAINEAGNTTVCLELTEGEYGIKVLHDLNDNKINDRDTRGMPTESFVFSRKNTNVVIPSFFDSLIEVVNNKPQSLSLALMHPQQPPQKPEPQKP